ncbi:MAG: hypothetical protein ACJ798_05470 [Phenylobacterium sp.]
MFLPATLPEPPPAITAEQQADLDCVSVGLAAGGGVRGRSPWDTRLVRFYLGRLTLSDRDRDWRARVVVLPDTLTYGEFMRRFDACAARLPPPRGR